MPTSQPKRIINISVLPGEPTDGSGRVCIHLFVQGEGPATYTEPHVLHPAVDEHGQPVRGQLEARPTRGRLACGTPPTASRPPAGSPRGGSIRVVHRTDDPRAVTCPRCKATEAYKEMMARAGESQ